MSDVTPKVITYTRCKVNKSNTHYSLNDFMNFDRIGALIKIEIDRGFHSGQKFDYLVYSHNGKKFTNPTLTGLKRVISNKYIGDIGINNHKQYYLVFNFSQDWEKLKVFIYPASYYPDYSTICNL